MIPMKMGDDNVEIMGDLVAVSIHNLLPEIPEAGSGLAEDKGISITNFNTRCIEPVCSPNGERKILFHKGVDIIQGIESLFHCLVKGCFDFTFNSQGCH